MSVAAEAIQTLQSDKKIALAANQQVKELLDLVQGKPLPVFSQTVKQLERFQDKPNSSIPKIVETLKLDPGYSHQILVTANKGLVKNKREPASSLDHAILLLGIPQIIMIGKQLPLITDQKDLTARSRILQIISRAYHAGVQARELMSVYGKTSTKTAFLTAQLQNIYLVSLWFYAPEEMTRLIKTPAGGENILIEIRKNLAKCWHFSDLFQESFNPRENSSHLVKAIAFSSQIVQIADNGWYTEQMENFITISSEQLGYPEELLYKLIHWNAVIAAHESTFYPVKPVACRLLDIETPEKSSEKVSPVTEREKPSVAAPVKSPPEKPVAVKRVKQKKTIVKKPTHDLESQLKILVEMGKKRRPPQEILEFGFKLLSGIAGKNAVVFFLLDKNRTFLKSRFTHNLENQKQSILLPLKQKNIFKLLLQKQQQIWINPKNREKFSSLLPVDLSVKINKNDFFGLSLFIQNKPIGLFFLENTTDLPLSSELYQQFVSICRTISTSLEEVKKHDD